MDQLGSTRPTFSRWRYLAVALHGLAVLIFLLLEPRVPRERSAAFRAGPAPEHGMDLGRHNYGLPVGVTFVAERLWSVAYRPLWYRALVLLDLPALIISGGVSLLLFPLLSELEPWVRSWLVFGVFLFASSLQWWLVSGVAARVAARRPHVLSPGAGAP